MKGMVYGNANPRSYIKGKGRHEDIHGFGHMKAEMRHLQAALAKKKEPQKHEKCQRFFFSGHKEEWYERKPRQKTQAKNWGVKWIHGSNIGSEHVEVVKGIGRDWTCLG